MNLFYDDGHLSEDGLHAIVEEKLDEMERLEAAEHLSFCDKCLVDYTNLLTEEALLVPEKDLKDPVVHRIRNRKVHILIKKYVTVAAAAVFAVSLLHFNIFSFSRSSRMKNIEKETTAQIPTQTLSEKITDSFSYLFGHFFEEPTKTDSPSEKDEKTSTTTQQNVSV